ncbi:MAG: DUF3450 domain-containing protein [Desulfobacteraceae bacterium]
MNRYKSILLIFIIFAMASFNISLADDHYVEDRIEKPVNDALDTRQKSQEEQDEWHREKQQKTALYENLEIENVRLKERIARLEQDKKALAGRIESKTLQLEQIKQISEQISPYLREVFNRLDTFYQNDMPFLMDERSRRIVNLSTVLSDPDITVSEKTRKIMEALMVEAEYGQTIEVTRDTVEIEGKATLVDIFRFGRIVLFYRTLDGCDCGFYNVADKNWQPLSGSYSEAIGTVIEIGAKRRPVELISLPIGRLRIQ